LSFNDCQVVLSILKSGLYVAQLDKQRNNLGLNIRGGTPGGSQLGFDIGQFGLGGF